MKISFTAKISRVLVAGLVLSNAAGAKVITSKVHKAEADEVIMPIYTEGKAGDGTPDLTAYIEVTKIPVPHKKGQYQYKLVYQQSGQNSVTIGPNPGGVYSEAEMQAARKRTCAAEGACMVDATAKGAVTGVTGFLAVALAGGGFAAAPAVSLCTVGTLAGAALTGQAVNKSGTIYECYRTLNSAVNDKSKDTDAMKLFNEYDKQSRFMEKAMQQKLGIVIQKNVSDVYKVMNDMLTPNADDEADSPSAAPNQAAGESH